MAKQQDPSLADWWPIVIITLIGGGLLPLIIFVTGNQSLCDFLKCKSNISPGDEGSPSLREASKAQSTPTKSPIITPSSAPSEIFEPTPTVTSSPSPLNPLSNESGNPTPINAPDSKPPEPSSLINVTATELYDDFRSDQSYYDWVEVRGEAVPRLVSQCNHDTISPCVALYVSGPSYGAGVTCYFSPSRVAQVRDINREIARTRKPIIITLIGKVEGKDRGSYSEAVKVTDCKLR